LRLALRPLVTPLVYLLLQAGKRQVEADVQPDLEPLIEELPADVKVGDKIWAKWMVGREEEVPKKNKKYVGVEHMGIIAAIVEGKKMADISYCDGQAEKHVAFEHIRVRVELSANEKRAITVAKKKAEKEGATAAAAGEQLTKAYEEFMEDEIAPASQEY
jgi:hypothetical protein